MALTSETLLAPVSDDDPVGEDLSYDPERSEIEQAFEREETFGEDAEAEDARDWRSVIRLIEGQFARTKDVWLAVYLARAGAEAGSLEQVQTGVEALAGLFEQYWDTVHPQLEELGVPGRKSPCDSLANRRAFLAPLERTALIAHPRLGRFSGADVERFRSEGGAADGYGLFRAAIDDLGQEGLQEALERVEAIQAALRRADQAFMTAAMGEESPNYGPTYQLLAQMTAGLKSFTDSGADAEASGPDGDGDDAPGPSGGAPARGVSGAVNSREDVRRVLGLVEDYYRRQEPGHPMPLILQRAVRWVDMDYLTLLRDIAPQGMTEAEEILNTRDGVLEE